MLPKPSYPALFRQDTTYPWNTDFGGYTNAEVQHMERLGTREEGMEGNGMGAMREVGKGRRKDR